MPEPGPSYRNLFEKVHGQGSAFDTHEPPADGCFYACLSKADFDETEKRWIVLFQVVNCGWMEHAVFSRPTDVGALPPRSPALFYFLESVEEGALLKALDLPGPEYLAEGSWFQLTLKPGEGAVSGVLHHPDLDMVD